MLRMSIAPCPRMDLVAAAFQAPIPLSKALSSSPPKRPFVSSERKHTLHTNARRLPPPSRLTILRISPSARHDWSTLTPSDFDEKLANSALPLCLVGMSNSGKSHWSTQLHRRRGFNVVCVDDNIERAIKPELSALGYSGIDGLAAWMGFPTDDQFAVNQQKYLLLEESITAAAPAGPGNTVLDTTGSVCYLSESTLRRLQHDYLVVHLKASDDMLQVMTDRYFTTPKPVVWGNSFDRRDGETPEEALRRCYPALLRHRRKRYEEIAHLNIPAAKSLSRHLNIEGFMSLVRSQLLVSDAADATT